MKLITKTAILFAAVMLVSAVTVFAQPFGMGIGRERGPIKLFAEPIFMGQERGHVKQFVEPVLMGHGFALDEDQYHILHVNVIKTREASPGFIRSLLWQKKSPEEIAKEINDAEMSTMTRADLRFAGQAYALNITGYDDQSLTGDVLTLPPDGTDRTGFTPATVGHISLSISEYEGEMLSTGTLTMNGTDYKVLMTSPMKLRIMVRKDST
ncbi:hypothetical protein ANME2D_01136 [Candidatus Methanoperedens nitroreducens]|uniref:Uncharacterized protein n=1 Tax=Candidatus Methanoperedens nitratireducens TaxID=1392998 RepID=A0A062VBM1_9EURY|nr:hypothetical protein [Candidatus Methanoperedens nitroreducens]KCZ72705.1 hypothetical protein ANME2D_01136 [Candidatus Methanoperedens nitroreducens]MDJ1423362.1 hypothetical protein [Candidatus Methanoperedens sp.]